MVGSTFGGSRSSKVVGVAAAAAAVTAEPTPARPPAEGAEVDVEEGVRFDPRCALDMNTDMRGLVRPEVTSFFTLMAPPGGASWVTRGASPIGRSRQGTTGGVAGLLLCCMGTAAAVVVPQAAAGAAGVTASKL